MRSRNAAGYPSPWVTRCVGRPYDDGLLAASPQWRSVTTGAGWELGLSEASSAGATLTTRDTVIARRLEVLAQTCSGCGAVRVYVGSRYVGKVSLASPATRSKVLVPLPPLSSTVTGKVRLVSRSRAQVRVDGLLVLRT